METQGKTKEQLIAIIDFLNKQILELKSEEARHKKAETALQASDEKFRLLFNIAPIGLIITNKQGDIINFNKTIQDLLGYSLDTSKIMNIIDLYAEPGERQRLLDILYESNRVCNFETIVKHCDGSTRTVIMNSDYLDLDNEKILLTSVHDITQLKKIQEDLLGSEKEYHLLFSNAPVGITVTDFQGGLIADNQAIQELLGYNTEELKNKNVYDFYYDAGERQRLLDLTEKVGIVRDFETRFRHKNGSAIAVLINTDLIDFKDQRKVLLTSIRDITGLKQVEKELTRERDFISAVLDIATSLIMVLDQDGMVTRFNRACEVTTGYTFREIKEQHVWDALSIDPALTRMRVEKLLAGNYPSTHEGIWIAKNGTRRLISWTNTTLLNNEGKVEYIIATGIDITEQRQAEIELQKANQKLVSWVKELEERTTEMNQLSEMGEQLQNCQTIEEACAISAQYIRRICPASHGALYLINASKNMAEAAQMWGDPVSTEKTFMPLNCWSVRRGRLHLIDDDHPGLRCEHIIGSQTGQYLCVPMLINGEAIGILHLNHTAALKEEQQESTYHLYNEHKTQLIMTMTDHIALALSNLKLRETLRQQSIRDILTGLFNRRYMEETLTRELQRAEREKISIGVIMLDIDHFKNFNDLSGHDGGDALLRELGLFLKKSTRGGDIVCRYGGEEFVALLPNATLEETRLRAEELRLGVKGLLVYHLGKPLGKCTISLGVAAFPECGLTSEALLKNADNALYRAKDEGRDKVVVSLINS
ncbi:MAG: diguanylate cyclase [Clostridiaceae bacterium]|nr:diguanylate cyclase [Clostridiaceae bacterium]